MIRRLTAKLALVGMVMTVLLNTMCVKASEETDKNTACDIVFALDISGSMKKTDENKTSIEIMKMVIDMCDVNDRVGFVAYNDTIAYSYGLTDLSDESKKQELKDVIDQIEFSGETDIGLGLRKSVDAVMEDSKSDANKMVILLSDGKTDLANSNSGRTLEDSEADINESLSISKENKISIHTIGYANQYSQELDYLTVLSANTGGSSNIVAGPLQLLDIVNRILCEYKNGNIKTTQTLTGTGEVQNTTVSISSDTVAQSWIMVLSAGDLTDFKVNTDNKDVSTETAKHYALVKINNPIKGDISLDFTYGQGNNIIISSVEIEKPEEEPTPVVAPPVVEKVNQVPVAIGSIEETLCTSKGSKTYDVSKLFEDADHETLQYTVSNIDKKGVTALLDGHTLSVTPKKYSNCVITIDAEDAAGAVANTTITIHSQPIWKYYFKTTITIAILVIIAITILLAFLIVKIFFKSERKKYPDFHGYVFGQFIDLKSKNETKPLSWDLAAYPNEGVTLAELFNGIQIYEDLPHMDNLCFYPDNDKSILMVHCMGGGVFVGEENVPINTPKNIYSGDTIYISFADNASELELQYTV